MTMYNEIVQDMKMGATVYTFGAVPLRIRGNAFGNFFSPQTVICNAATMTLRVTMMDESAKHG